MIEGEMCEHWTAGLWSLLDGIDNSRKCQTRSVLGAAENKAEIKLDNGLRHW
jgi:hypothetical protein